MTISIESENDVIVYALEKIIAFARSNQYIFLAQSLWWISSVIELQTELVNHIDNLKIRSELVSIPKDVIAAIPEQQKKNDPNQKDKIFKECEEFLRDSRRVRDLEAPKTRGKTSTGKINPLASTKSVLRVKKKRSDKDCSRTNGDKKGNRERTEGIDIHEISRRQLPGECLRCAWPSDRKETHLVKVCVRPIKLREGTTNHPKEKSYRIEDLKISSEVTSGAEASTNEE